MFFFSVPTSFTVQMFVLMGVITLVMDASDKSKGVKGTVTGILCGYHMYTYVSTHSQYIMSVLGETFYTTLVEATTSKLLMNFLIFSLFFTHIHFYVKQRPVQIYTQHFITFFYISYFATRYFDVINI